MTGAVRNAASKGRACPGCGSFRSSHFADERLDQQKVSEFTYASRKQPEFMCLKLVCCLDCDLVFAPLPPDNSFLSGAYADAAYDSVEEASCAARSYARALQAPLRNLASRSAAVDVGAGSGPLLPWLKRSGFREVIGIEPSRQAIAAASPEVVPWLREGMFSASALENTPLALICSFMTLEHLRDPGQFARTAFDLLEPDGMVAVVVHNRSGFLNRMLGMKSPIIDVEHLQLFNPRSITVLLECAGFEDIQVKSISNSYPLRYWLRLMPLPATLKRVVAYVLERTGLANLRIALRVGNIIATGKKTRQELK